MPTSKDHPRSRSPSAVWVVGADRWGIVADKWNGSGNQGSAFTPWRAPVIDGVWDDIEVHIKWSVCDHVGFVELWHNGAPQTFGCKPLQFTRRTL